MKLFSFFCLIALSFNMLGQDYYAPKPLAISIQTDTISSGKLGVAWFCPEGSFLVAKTYKKMEIGVDIPVNLEQKITAFFEQKGRRDGQINPYNRNDVTISSEFFRDGVSKYVSHAFYYEEFKKDLQNNQWLKDTTSYPFRIRFAPAESGLYKAVITVNAKNFRTLTVSFEFNVEQSASNGYLEVGANGKHLRYSGSKESFFGVGQDIPWTSWEDWSKLDKGVGPKRFEEIYRALKAFDKANGNFTRFVVAPWFMQLEWEALGNYSPKQGHAWEFDRITDYCEDKEIYYLFCGLLHSPLESRSDEKDGMLPGVRWETYCYNDMDRTPSEFAAEKPIGITKATEFYSNPKATDHVKNYYRYLVSRYGYSTALAGWQLMSEVDETAEYRDGEKDGVNIDHSANRMAVRNWADAISTYMKEDLKDQHLVSLAIIKGKGYTKTFWDPELFNLPNIDYFGLHDYIFEQSNGVGKIRNRNLLIRYASVNQLNMGFQNDSISYPSYQNKPFIYDEFGHLLTVPRKSPEDEGVDPTADFNECADFMLKQDLWFTLSAGCAVAGLDWWNQDKPQRQAMWGKFYPGILSFTADIDFEKVDYTAIKEVKGQQMIAQRWPLSEKEIKQSNGKDYHKDDLLEAYIQLASDQSQGFGWMSNRSVNWYNMTEYYPCLKNMLNGTEPYAIPYLTKPEDADAMENPIDIKDDTYFIKVYNLKRRTQYTVDFYSTSSGKKITSKTEKTNGKGIMKMHAPEMKFLVDPDVGFKFIESGQSWR